MHSGWTPRMTQNDLLYLFSDSNICQIFCSHRRWHLVLIGYNPHGQLNSSFFFSPVVNVLLLREYILPILCYDFLDLFLILLFLINVLLILSLLFTHNTSILIIVLLCSSTLIYIEQYISQRLLKYEMWLSWVFGTIMYSIYAWG